MRPAASARRAFWLLAALGATSLAALGGLLAWQGQRLAEGVWLACQSAAAAVVGLLPALGLMLPVLVLVAGLLGGLGSLAWQLWNTHRLVGAVIGRAPCRCLSRCRRWRAGWAWTDGCFWSMTPTRMRLPRA